MRLESGDDTGDLLGIHVLFPFEVPCLDLFSEPCCNVPY